MERQQQEQCVGWEKRDPTYLGENSQKYTLYSYYIAQWVMSKLFKIYVGTRGRRSATRHTLVPQRTNFSQVSSRQFFQQTCFGYRYFTEYTSELCRHRYGIFRLQIFYVSATHILQSTQVSSADMFQLRTFYREHKSALQTFFSHR